MWIRFLTLTFAVRNRLPQRLLGVRVSFRYEFGEAIPNQWYIPWVIYHLPCYLLFIFPSFPITPLVPPASPTSTFKNEMIRSRFPLRCCFEPISCCHFSFYFSLTFSAQCGLSKQIPPKFFKFLSCHNDFPSLDFDSFPRLCPTLKTDSLCRYLLLPRIPPSRPVIFSSVPLPCVLSISSPIFPSPADDRWLSGQPSCSISPPPLLSGSIFFPIP